MVKIKVKTKPTESTEPIAQKVLQILGYPSNFTRVTATNVFESNYRVNVWVRSENHEIISDSFFITMENNSIVYVNPSLVNKYKVKKPSIMDLDTDEL